MGKKKKAKRAAEQAAYGSKDAFALPPQVAGIAAMLARQAATPAARQMIAGALAAAAGAVARGNSVRADAPPVSPAPPVPPAPPIPPAPPVPPVPPAPSYAPDFGMAKVDLPPEAIKAIDAAATHASRAIDAAAAAIERWAERIGKPTPPPS